MNPLRSLDDQLMISIEVMEPNPSGTLPFTAFFATDLASAPIDCTPVYNVFQDLGTSSPEAMNSRICSSEIVSGFFRICFRRFPDELRGVLIKAISGGNSGKTPELFLEVETPREARLGTPKPAIQGI